MHRFFGAGDERRGGKTASRQKNFVFVYGPLISADNRHRSGFADKVAMPVILKDFQRFWSDFTLHLNVAMLNIKKQTDSECNGVLLEMDEKDLQEFDYREFNFRRMKVDKKLFKPFFKKDSIPDGIFWVAYHPDLIPAKKRLPILSSYLDVVLTGTLTYGKEFAEMFLDTTDNWTEILDDRESPIYARAIKNLTHREEIDNLLYNKFEKENDIIKKVFSG